MQSQGSGQTQLVQCCAYRVGGLKAELFGTTYPWLGFPHLQAALVPLKHRAPPQGHEAIREFELRGY